MYLTTMTMEDRLLAAKVAVPNALADDEIKEGQPFKISDWILQGRQFYNNAINTPEIQAKLVEYNVNQESLQEALSDIDKLEQLKIAQEKEKGEAQRATQNRDESFAQLNEYMYGLVQIARVMLYDKEQLLEKMGIAAPSE